jgi:hypothetical protein
MVESATAFRTSPPNGREASTAGVVLRLFGCETVRTCRMRFIARFRTDGEETASRLPWSCSWGRNPAFQLTRTERPLQGESGSGAYERGGVL